MKLLGAFLLVTGGLALAAPAAGAGATEIPATPVTASTDTLTLALTLEDAIAAALADGEEIRIARSGLLEARGRVREALSNALPRIEGSLTYNRKLESVFRGVSQDTVFGPLLTNSPFAAAHTWDAQLNGSWLIFSSGKVGAALRGAKAVRRGAAAQERESEAQVTLAVTRAYYEAAFQQRRVDIAEAGLEQAQAHLAQVRLYRGEGTRSEYDLLRAQVDAANQAPAVVAARHGLDVALLELKRLVNLPLDRPVRLTSTLDFGDAGVPVPAEPALEAEHRHALEAAEADVDFARQQLRFQRGRNGFDLTLQSTLTHSAFLGEEKLPARTDFRRAWDASLKLEMPIFNGFQVAGLVDQARAQLERAQATRDRLRRQTEVDLAEARAELARTLAELAARRETVRQAARAHELAGVRFRNGLSTQLEVSDARLQLQTAEVNEVQASRDYRLALAQLEAVLGRPVRLEHRTLEAIDKMTLLPGEVKR